MLTVGKYSITWEQCDTKWKYLKHKYKELKNGRNKSGNGRDDWEFFQVCFKY